MLRPVQFKWYTNSVLGGEESWIKADRERERIHRAMREGMEARAEIEEEKE